jgi:uncharacterized Zn finger protein
MSWDWYRREPTQRRPANGIRAQTQKGQFGKTWWAGKWIAALERLVDSARLSRGRSYARSGQVLKMEIQPGRVDARVQGSRPTPYKVQITIKPLPDAEWEQVADAMAAQAIFAAKLLAGEMPQDIEEAFTSANISLFPASRGDLQTECSCPDWANPCKHVAAVYYLLGEQFDADPFLLFRLRGRSKDEIIAMLRARRTAPPTEEQPEAQAAPAASAPLAADVAAPLEDNLDHFWEAPVSLEDVHVSIERPVVDAAPVKRLGPAGFWGGRGELTAFFANVYRSVSQASLDEVVETEAK